MIDQPIPSQCVTSTVLNKPKGLMSVATKVAVQMNAKLGGEPWAVKIPMKDTMIIGYVICWSCSHCLEFHCHSSIHHSGHLP